MKIQDIWEKADSLRGCLSALKTTQSRRRVARDQDEDPLCVENLFVSDEAKLLSSKPYRILSDKTQVFTSPRSSLIRNRATHTMEVVACSVVASELLGLNTDLVRAAAIGHDIGHVPCGHQGESWMARTMGRSEFCHELMGPVIAQRVVRNGRGMNLTWHTLQAMLCHSGKTIKPGVSQEALTLRYVDKFAYIFHDINDIVIRMKYPVCQEILGIADSFGKNQRERTTTAIAGLVIESSELGYASFEKSDLGQKFQRLRDLMYEVYVCVTQQNVEAVLRPVLDFLDMIKIGDPLALMTDKDAISLSRESMKDMQAFNRTAVSEIVPYLQRIGKIDLCDPGLDW